jgi:hypothetical protein
LNQALCSFHARVDERRNDLQIPRQTTEKIQRAFDQLDQGGSLFPHSSESDRGILVEAEDGLVNQRNIGPASFAHLDPISAAIGVVQSRWLPLGLTRSTDFDVPLHGNDSGYRRIADRRREGWN